MKILYAAATMIAISVSAGLIAAQGCRPVGEPEPAVVLVENQRLRSENDSLVRENVRLSTENENLQERLNELLREQPVQEGLTLENQRLRGELDRTRIDAAEELARRDQLEEAIEEERRGRLRLEALLDNANRRNDTGNFGWLGWLAALALASALLWREWLRSKTFPTATLRRVVPGDTDAMAQRVTDVTPVEVESQDRRAP